MTSSVSGPKAVQMLHYRSSIYLVYPARCSSCAIPAGSSRDNQILLPQVLCVLVYALCVSVCVLGVLWWVDGCGYLYAPSTATMTMSLSCCRRGLKRCQSAMLVCFVVSSWNWFPVASNSHKSSQSKVSSVNLKLVYQAIPQPNNTHSPHLFPAGPQQLCVN